MIFRAILFALATAAVIGGLAYWLKCLCLCDYENACDYSQCDWFKVVGDTKDELTKKYMEMCMVSVTEVVYSNKEQALGVKRLFPFNYDVIMPDDTELKDMLESLVNEVNG